MTYAVTTRRRRNSSLGSTTLGFDWGSLFTNIGASAAQASATAGIQKLTQAIAGSKTPTAAAPAATAPAATSTTAGGIPIWGWALGGMGLVVILILAMGRR